MARYLISFDHGSMTFPEADLPVVAAASPAVVREARAAGARISGGGILSQQAGIVAPDGAVCAGAWPETKAVIGGFSIIEVASRAQALSWAARIAAACRCAQEVCGIMYDPES
jgi:hypothetical protein